MTKLSRQNVGGIDYTMVGCALTGVCASAASDYVKIVTLSDGDILADGMTVAVTFANGNTAGTAPASLTIYSSDQVNYYSDSGLTQPFTLAPSGCYEIEYTGTGNAYTYTSYPVIQIAGVTAPVCDSCGKKTSGAVWDAGDTVLVLYSGSKFMIISGLTNSVTAGSRKAVTSGAVAGAMSSLPTDAVLHYSFDDIPDYPDGTADVRLINNTYDLQSMSQYFRVNAGVGATISNVNGNIKVTVTTGGTYRGVNIPNEYIKNKVVKLKISILSCSGAVVVDNGVNMHILNTDKVGTYEVSCIGNAFTTANNALFVMSNYAYELTIDAIYIGDGSYSTPIIDNANGQNNATNNGGIAVKGVSGKGAYFINGKNTTLNDFNFTDNFSISVWVKPDNMENGKMRDIVTKSSCFYFRNGDSGSNNLLFGAIYNKTTGRYEYFYIQLTLLDNTKYTHICITKNGATVKTFVDGVLSRTTNFNFTEMNRNNNSLNINGTINTSSQSYDDLLIFDRALSDTEVMALYLNKANTPKYYSKADWKLSQV